jgi:hypothetical protein
VDLVEKPAADYRRNGKHDPKAREPEDRRRTFAAVNKIKNESELHLLVALGELYESGPLLPEGLLYIMMWTQIYDRIEQALEKAEHLSNILEGVSIKNA